MIPWVEPLQEATAIVGPNGVATTFWAQLWARARTRWQSADLVITPGSIPANTTAEITATLSGAQTRDIAFVNKPTATAGLVLGGARISAANILAIQFGNLTAGAIDPGTETYRVLIYRPA